jgi:hypothetical protein
MIGWICSLNGNIRKIEVLWSKFGRPKWKKNNVDIDPRKGDYKGGMWTDWLKILTGINSVESSGVL